MQMIFGIRVRHADAENLLNAIHHWHTDVGNYEIDLAREAAIYNAFCTMAQ
jgi:hypothetical protein